MAGDLPGKKSPSCTKPPCIGTVYMALYNASAVGVKAVHSSLKVGGPATEHLNTQNFMSQAKEMGAPVDFVSSHNYPTGPRGDGSGCPQGTDNWLPDCFTEHVMATRADIPASTPLLITEYSVMVGEGMADTTDTTAGLSSAEKKQGEPPFQHDDPGAAAFVFRVVPQLSPHLEALSYWTFSDSKHLLAATHQPVCSVLRAPCCVLRAVSICASHAHTRARFAGAVAAALRSIRGEQHPTH
jgi:hypothetical protein